MPEKVGPYQIESHIGSGGMGEVYRAYDARLDRRVALKQIKPEAARRPQIRKRFLREARAAARLSHPTVVQVHDILHEGGSDWIVMELAEGRSLRDILRPGPLSFALTLELAVELAAGLTFAHEHGIVHRDLKSDNVVLTPTGRAKILDFGLAKDLVVDDSSVSKIGQLIGTPRCMSPEQATGQEIDHRSDLFSFGILLYEMLTGESPFSAPSPLQSVTRVCSHDPPPPGTLNPDVPEELDRLVTGLLEKDRENRPRAARVVLGELQRIAGEHLRQPGEESAGSGYTPTFLPPVGGTVPELEEREPRPWQRTPVLLSVAVLMAIGVGLAVWLGLEGAPGAAETPSRIDGELLATGLPDPATLPTAGPASPPSVAVLPFDDMGNGEHPFFADAVADEIGQRLPDLHELVVVSRWSSEDYRVGKKTPQEIGEELGVEHLLRGRVFWGSAKEEGMPTVRVEVDLVRASDGALVWYATYGRDVDDLFRAQAQISEKVLEELSVVLFEEASRSPAPGH